MWGIRYLLQLSHVDVVFYICASNLCDRTWAEFQLILTWLESPRFSSLPKIDSQSKTSDLVLCSGIMHDRLATAWGAFHMLSADPVCAAPFVIQPSGLQVRTISRALLLLLLLLLMWNTICLFALLDETSFIPSTQKSAYHTYNYFFVPEKKGQ